MSPGDISVGINSLLICFEMIIFSILHLWAFPWKTYELPSEPYDVNNANYSYYQGGKFGIKAYINAFNPLDTVKAIARGVKWVICGWSRRHGDAEKIIARKESKRIVPSGRGSEEEMGLVKNAAKPGTLGFEGYSKANSGGVYAEAGDDELQVYHPSPMDARVEASRNDQIEYSQHRPQSEELANPASRIPVGRQDNSAPDLRLHPAFMNNTPPTASYFSEASPPYPQTNRMPSVSYNRGGREQYGFGNHSAETMPLPNPHQTFGISGYGKTGQSQNSSQRHNRQESDVSNPDPRPWD